MLYAHASGTVCCLSCFNMLYGREPAADEEKVNTWSYEPLQPSEEE
jgi:prenyltransferase beta subunit